jgi:hypothetical protein
MAAYHAKGFREAGAEIIALATSTAPPPKGRRPHGISRHFSDVGEMLKRRARARRRLDHRAEQVPRPARPAGLKAGKHVFCEKPPGDERQGDGASSRRPPKAAKRR